MKVRNPSTIPTIVTGALRWSHPPFRPVAAAIVVVGF
jgi:hypothetical protein